MRATIWRLVAAYTVHTLCAAGVVYYAPLALVGGVVLLAISGGLLPFLWAASHRHEIKQAQEKLELADVELESAQKSIRAQEDLLKRYRDDNRMLERLAISQQRSFATSSRVAQRAIALHDQLVKMDKLDEAERAALDFLKTILVSTETPPPPH